MWSNLYWKPTVFCCPTFYIRNECLGTQRKWCNTRKPHANITALIPLTWWKCQSWIYYLSSGEHDSLLSIVESEFLFFQRGTWFAFFSKEDMINGFHRGTWFTVSTGKDDSLFSLGEHDSLFSPGEHDSLFSPGEDDSLLSTGEHIPWGKQWIIWFTVFPRGRWFTVFPRGRWFTVLPRGRWFTVFQWGDMIYYFLLMNMIHFFPSGA